MITNYAQFAQDYKRSLSNQFMLVDGAKLTDKVKGEDLFVTLKVDGILQVLFYHNEMVEAYGTNGRRTIDLPCLQEFASLCHKAGLQQAVIAAELFAPLNGRERVGDVATALADPALHDKLHLAPHNIIELNGEPFAATHYKQTHQRLMQLFDHGELVHPVIGNSASSAYEVEAFYDHWVTDGGAEGVVVHCENPMVWKVKPRHTIDAVIVGYTVDDEHPDHLREMLLAVDYADGMFQQFAVTGGGMSDDEKMSMQEHLSQLCVTSEYIATDSRNVAFQMVKPEVVVEMSCLELVAEDGKGRPKENTLMSYHAEQGYLVEGSIAGFAAHSPNFVRLRPDKRAIPADIRHSQLTDLCAPSEQKCGSCLNALHKSQVLLRRIFTKGSGEKLMVQKYLVWKTNKEETGVFPAYVFHYTDFSVGRKEALKRDIRVSSSRQQIMDLCELSIEENVKKGWTEL